MIQNTEIIIYQTPDGTTKIDARLENGNIWLNQEQIAKLYGLQRPAITKHINHIFEEGELDEKVVCSILELTTPHGAIANKTQIKNVKFYNLDLIIAVGYRVKSSIGTKFRQWGTERLHEYIEKGFTMNDELLKNMGGGLYWKELLERIRDIRSSEKVFYRQVLDIYATSIDYNPKSPETLKFFKIVQNKMHFAVHNHTASELIFERVNGSADFAGLTTWSGTLPKISDAVIAKNYLSSEELDKLNRLTTMFLDQAEYMAKQHIQMTMKDWIKELDNLLLRMRNNLLEDAGKISNEEATNKAETEFKKYQNRIADNLSDIEKHYLENLINTEKFIEGQRN